MRTWTAMVAPLGKPCCKDGPKVLRDDVEWTLVGRPPLRPEPRGHDAPPVIGEVTVLVQDGDKLMLYGTLFDEVDAAALEGLAPQIDVDISSSEVWRLRALTLGQSPLWPDLWFRLDPVEVPA